MSNARNILRHPVLWVALVLGGLTAFVLLTGQPLSRVTQIAVYMLYGAGVNLLMGYTGLVPFGASVFFGLASYAAALSMGSLFGVEVGALLFSIAFSFALASRPAGSMATWAVGAESKSDSRRRASLSSDGGSSRRIDVR